MSRPSSRFRPKRSPNQTKKKKKKTLFGQIMITSFLVVVRMDTKSMAMLDDGCFFFVVLDGLRFSERFGLC